MHNLVPSIGEVNGDRSNFSFGWLPEQSGQYGSCLTQIDFKAKKVMPRPSIRGMIARTYFYMSKQYGLRLSKLGSATVRSLGQDLSGTGLGTPTQPERGVRHGARQRVRRPGRHEGLRLNPERDT